MAAVGGQDILDGQIFIEAFPMNTESAADQFPACPLARSARPEARKKSQRHAYLLFVVECDGQKIAIKGKALNSDAIHRRVQSSKHPIPFSEEFVEVLIHDARASPVQLCLA